MTGIIEVSPARTFSRPLRMGGDETLPCVPKIYRMLGAGLAPAFVQSSPPSATSTHPAWLWNFPLPARRSDATIGFIPVSEGPFGDIFAAPVLEPWTHWHLHKSRYSVHSAPPLGSVEGEALPSVLSSVGANPNTSPSNCQETQQDEKNHITGPLEISYHSCVAAAGLASLRWSLLSRLYIRPARPQLGSGICTRSS